MSVRSNFLAQDESGVRFDQGMHRAPGHVLAIEPSLGLAVLACAEQPDSASPGLAVETLVDDMQSNLDSVTRSDVSGESPALICLRESLDNIAEFLREEGRTGVSLAAVQVDEEGRISLALAGHLSAYRLGPEAQRLVADDTRPLGEEPDTRALLQEWGGEEAACLLLMPEQDELLIGREFVELSLRRFCGAQDLLLRQMAQRGRRQGLARNPLMLLARGEPRAERPRGLLRRWLGR